MTLNLDPDELNTCVACGLCLPHCPTFRATGEEALSPRGRIDAMRAVQWRDAPIDSDFVHFMSTCVQCRGCEPACPSGVPFGHLIEGTREYLAEVGRITPWWQRLGFKVLPRHRLLLAGSTAIAIAQRLRLVPRRAGLATLPVRRGQAIRGTGTDVWLYTGCVMDAWLRDTHRSTASVLDVLGVTYAVPGPSGGCCGALHTHAGLHDESIELALGVMASMPGEAPILVNSAGCGAALKDYGRLLAPTGPDVSPPVCSTSTSGSPVASTTCRCCGDSTRPVIVQDPCHLRHVQRAHLPVREVIGRFADVVELDDDGVCCGAGGAYSALQPELAGRSASARSTRSAGDGPLGVAHHGERQPRLQHASRAGARAEGVTVRHPIDLLAEALP